MPAAAEIVELVQRFELHRESYQSAGYNETQLRREFVDPFFKALGWDVDNEQGYAEAYKDVIHEDAIKIGGMTKAPDYCFRVGGRRKFFVETKKPFVNIGKDVSAAFQLRRYAWTAKLPLSILTDFEEFAVYDCLIHKPVKTDKASKARTLYLKYTDYTDRWDEIASIFAREAILKGSFDKYALAHKKKRATAEVDDEFLKEIESWRTLLARNLALRNPTLSQRELNFAVQRTIDRIIFMRICEDRGVERSAQLQTLLNGPTVYPRLCELFQHADDRYNSGLFHFHEEKDRTEAPDEFTLSLTIDDKPLKQIISHLYYPDCPYEFSVLPADILGQVYEQFLGKVIRLTAGHQAQIDEKSEVKKAGGVFYTPAYIVEYIVQQTVGKLLEGKTPQEVGGLTNTWKPSKSKQPLTVLDPACGSGSFLIGAYQKLLDWYRDWYVDAGPKKHQERIYEAAGGEWRLTSAERKRILLSHIYGVDIDSQAVEVTKLSLLLKVLEGENQETLNRQLKLFQERALPDLAANIKCGNSLIGPDFYDGQQTPFDEEEALRINAFDWRTEFVDIMRAGGFEAVIGNPPYRRELDYKHLMAEIATTRFGAKYRAPRMDLWFYFVHRGLDLLQACGILSFIVNAYWTAGTGAEKLIAALRERTNINEIFFFKNLNVFKKVSGQHMTMRITNEVSDSPTTVKVVNPSTETTAEPFVTGVSPVAVFTKSSDQLFRNGKVDLEPPSDALLAKIGKHPSLDTLGIVRQGIAENPASINKKTNEKHNNPWTVGEGVFALSSEELKRLSLPDGETSLLRPYHDLCDIDRYWIAEDPSLRLIYSSRYTCSKIDVYPTLRSHLERFRKIMEPRRETKNGSNSWWHLHWPRDESIWQSPKIVSVQMGKRPVFVPATEAVYVPFSVNVFVPNDKRLEDLTYLTGLLNSRLMWKWYQHHAKRRGVGIEINGNVLKRTPVRWLNPEDENEKPHRDRMIALVDQMLTLNRDIRRAQTAHRKTIIQHHIDTTDRQIDELVYELYGLTDAEIQIVEEATA